MPDPSTDFKRNCVFPLTFLVSAISRDTEKPKLNLKPEAEISQQTYE